MYGPAVPRSAPSCVTWGYRPSGCGQRSELPCRPRIWTSGSICSVGIPAADEPVRKWCGDIPTQAGGAHSYVRTWSGFVYLVTVLDCCTKKVVGSDGRPHAHFPGVPGH